MQNLEELNLAELKTLAKENNINKTALILVGDFLSGEYERSKLYDPGFSHEFREASLWNYPLFPSPKKGQF